MIPGIWMDIQKDRHSLRFLQVHLGNVSKANSMYKRFSSFLVLFSSLTLIEKKIHAVFFPYLFFIKAQVEL